MRRNWFVIIGLVLALAAVGLVACAPTSESITGIVTSQQEGIWVTGEGRVSVTPDLATLRLGIEALADTVSVAQAQAAEAMDEVMAALLASGIARKDIQTQFFSIQQVTRWDRQTEQQVVVGFRVTNRVTAKIRDIERAGAVIDSVAEAGGDLTRIDSISFSVDDPSVYHEEAREEAMADAKAKAEQLARFGGVRLGKLTYISEGGIAVPYASVFAESAVRGADVFETPISPGEIDIRLTVQVAYAIR